MNDVNFGSQKSNPLILLLSLMFVEVMNPVHSHCNTVAKRILKRRSRKIRKIVKGLVSIYIRARFLTAVSKGLRGIDACHYITCSTVSIGSQSTNGSRKF